MSVSVATMCHMTAGDMADVNVIGRRVFDGREALRLNQQEFADKAKLSRAYISRLERGLIPNPTITDLGQIADALGISVATLIAPETDLVRMRFSHEWDELQQQVEGLPPEIAEQVIRAWRESVAVIYSASALARRN